MKVVVESCSLDIVVLQETKKEVLPRSLVRWTLGPSLSKWRFVPSVGASWAFCVLGIRYMLIKLIRF